MADLYPSIWWRADMAQVTDYSASVKGSKSIVTIKLSVADPNTLGHLLEQIAAAKRAGAARKRSAKPLMLEDLRGRDEING